MDSVSISLSAPCPPQNITQGLNNRCILVCVSKVIKSQLWHTRPPLSFCTRKRVPRFCAMADERGNLQSTAAVPNSVPVRVANELMQAGHRYLDVRTTDEYDAGHVVGAVNAPFMLRTGSGMTRNPEFLKEVLKHFGKDDEIVVGCQLGKRSFMAATELMSAGFTGITDMAGGYAAWVENGLPTTQ